MANIKKIKERAEILLYLEAKDKAALKRLSDKTGMAVQDYLREGVAMVLKKYKGK